MKNDEDKWKIAQEKQKEWDRKRREKNKHDREQNEKQRELWKEKERLRKRKQRENKKLVGVEKINSSPLGSYKCLNTLKKAVVKTKKALPQSPAKQTAVLLHMVKDIMPKMAVLHEKLTILEARLLQMKLRKKLKLSTKKMISAVLLQTEKTQCR